MDTIIFDATTGVGVASGSYSHTPALSANELACTADEASSPSNWKLVNGVIVARTAADMAPSVATLIAYANKKQTDVLDALKVSYALKDGSATLDTMCDDRSLIFLNSLGNWASLNATASPAPTRAYYNLDGTSKTATPVQMAEFLSVVGGQVQASFDTQASVVAAITAKKPTVTTTAQIDAAAWPAST